MAFQVIGLSVAFHQVIGLSVAFHQVIGLPVTFQVIGLSVAFHQVIGLSVVAPKEGRVTMDHLGLPSGSRVAGHGEPESGPTRRQEQQARDDREGDGQWEPTQIDLLSVIATGARQLQDAQTKAFQKKSSQEEPEPVKPGVTSLPTLKGPDPETSPVEVQDWLQLLQAPMSDLSDNSAEWWGRVQELAQRAYQGWSSATPMEWLALRAPREKELEEGRFRTPQCSRCLHDPFVAGRDVLVLDHLQAPAKQTEPDKAAKALRDWERWYRRASDVGVSSPDPTVLLRALSFP